MKSLLVLSVWLTATLVQAQPSADLVLDAYGGNVSTVTSAALRNANLRSLLEKGRSAGDEPGDSYLPYSPTRALKSAVVQGYIDRLKPKNPAMAQTVITAFRSGKYDYGLIYTGLVKDNGLRANDAADVLTAYLVLGYMISNNVLDDKDVPPSMIRAVRSQLGPALAQNARLTAPDVAAQLGEDLKLQFVMVQAGLRTAIGQRTLTAYQQGIAALFKTQCELDWSQFRLTEQGLVGRQQPAGSSSGQTASNSRPPTNSPRPAASASAPVPAARPSSPAVENWFFRATYGYPLSVRFEPVVLFKNGEYYEVGEGPLEAMNQAQDKQQRPRAWGRWRKNGNTYLLTNSEGRVNDYKLGTGSWFPAYAYPSGIRLKKGYHSTSGGDNGAGTVSLAIAELHFIDATHFTEGLDAGIQAPNGVAGKRSGASGTYRIYDHTLELTYTNGKVVRQSFAIGASGNPPRPSNTILFIGGAAYTDID